MQDVGIEVGKKIGSALHHSTADRIHREYRAVSPLAVPIVHILLRPSEDQEPAAEQRP